jgi:glycosyltransferase involved in cell wall biosynthesis
MKKGNDINTVDVVIPYCEAYTPKSMLREAVSSVEAQTVTTDIIIIEDKNQRGPAWARNRGLRKSDNRYVAFLDADDLWEPDKLERQLAKMTEQDVGLCVEGSDMETHQFIRELLVGSLVSLTPSILIDRDKVTACFPEDMERYEDHFFMVEAALQGGVCLCKDLITVRKHETGLSASGTSKMEHQAMLEMADRLDRHPEMPLDVDEYRQHAHYKYARQLQKKGDWRGSIRSLMGSMQYGLKLKAVAALLLVPYYGIRFYLKGNGASQRSTAISG